jgi:tetrapyrrole methylase family protein/MazG family protein/ATP diphosphatase
MAEEEQRFSIGDVLERLAAKLIDRHPHVFGEATARTSGEVLRNWEALKAREKSKQLEEGREESSGPDSVLADVSSRMPALLEAHKLSSRAARVGFDWPEIQGLFQKLEEEAEELKAELARLPAPLLSRAAGVAGSGRSELQGELRARLEEELGDLFFVLVNIARYLSLDPESALRKTNRKFKRRFQWMEAELRAHGRTPGQATLAELESLWQRSKDHENEPLSRI